MFLQSLLLVFVQLNFPKESARQDLPNKLDLFMNQYSAGIAVKWSFVPVSVLMQGKKSIIFKGVCVPFRILDQRQIAITGFPKNSAVRFDGEWTVFLLATDQVSFLFGFLADPSESIRYSQIYQDANPQNKMFLHDVFAFKLAPAFQNRKNKKNQFDFENGSLVCRQLETSKVQWVQHPYSFFNKTVAVSLLGEPVDYAAWTDNGKSLIAIDWTLSMQSDQEAREKITQAVRQSAITADELVGGGIHLVSGDKINTIPLAQFLQGDFKVAAPPQPMLTLDGFEACLGIQGNGKKMGQVLFISRNADVTIREEDREEVPTSLKACLPKLPVKFVQLQGASVPGLKALLGGNYCLLNGDLLNWLLSEI